MDVSLHLFIGRPRFLLPIGACSCWKMKCINTRVQCINQNNRSNTIKIKIHTSVVNRSRACVWFEVFSAVLGWRISGMPTPCSWKELIDVSKEPPARSWKFPERVFRSTKLRLSTSQKTVIRTTVFLVHFLIMANYFMACLWDSLSEVEEAYYR